MTLRSLIACSLLAALAVLGCRSGDESVGTRVVLITLDTLRYDRFEPNDGGSSAMPLTRAHAERGLVFERYYTVSPVTQPVHATLFTGLQPWEHGVTRNGIVLPNRYASIVDTFKRNGFETGAVVASFPVTQRFGFARGFDHWIEDFSKNLNQNKKLWEEHWKIESGKFFATGDGVTSRALAQLSAARAKKQFFWFHYFDLHEPYGNASQPDSVMALEQIYDRIEGGSADVHALLAGARQRYDADARSLDLQLDRLLRRLTRDADRVDTHILVVSDHGESFGEDGSIGHGKRLSDALIRVPCLLISPAVDPGRVSAPVGSIDVPVTLLALAGLSGLEGAGRDMTRALPSDRSVFGMRRTFEQPFYELRLDGARHRLQDLSFFLADRTRVIVGDGNEVRSRAAGAAGNLQTSDSEALENAQLLFDRFAESLARSGTTTALDERSRAALEALGYIQ